MSHGLDILHTRGLEAKSASTSGPKPFLSVWYRCCHAYGRLYRNPAGTKYTGRCPRCGTRVLARIGTDGTARRVFEAR